MERQRRNKQSQPSPPSGILRLPFSSCPTLFGQDAWFFDEGYIPWVVRFVVEEMGLKASDSFVDIGGGTGNYTALMAKAAGLMGARYARLARFRLHSY
jgi:hypothetical protein